MYAWRFTRMIECEIERCDDAGWQRKRAMSGPTACFNVATAADTSRFLRAMKTTSVSIQRALLRTTIAPGRTANSWRGVGSRPSGLGLRTHPTHYTAT